MKKISAILLIITQMNLFATIADDLTTEIQNNNIPGIIATIDSASLSGVSLAQMLSFAQTALANTAASGNSAPYVNAARQYVFDFYSRPAINSTATNILWVDQSLFLAGQVGSGYNVVMTQDRLIFPTIQQAMSYLGYAGGGAWATVINQAFYDENIAVPAGQAITWTGVGGVVTGNGGMDQYASSDGLGTVTWNLNDSQNIGSPSFTMQSVAYGFGGYRNMPYMASFLIGTNFATNITGSITSSPALTFTSVYAFGGTGATDVGPIRITLDNFRSGGSADFTSASLQSINASTLVPTITAASCVGNISETEFFSPVTLTNGLTGLVKDTVFDNSNAFTSPPTLTLNKSANYWFITHAWTLGAGTTKVIIDQ